MYGYGCGTECVNKCLQWMNEYKYKQHELKRMYILCSDHIHIDTLDSSSTKKNCSVVLAHNGLMTCTRLSRVLGDLVQ